MIELRIGASDLLALRQTLLGHAHEQCAVLLASIAVVEKKQLVLVRELVFPTPADYSRTGVDHAELRPEFVAAIAKRARLDRRALVFVHTHPGSCAPHFSGIDDRGEERLSAFLRMRGQLEPHCAIVLSASGMAARSLGTDTDITVIAIGDHRSQEFPRNGLPSEISEAFDRQVRALGQAGQSALQRLRVAIVGVGGTGSIAAQQLAHLGVRDFVLVDPDDIETSNLNRVVGAEKSDVGTAKVSVTERLIKRIVPTAVVRAIAGDVVHAAIAAELTSADVLFCCTDSHGSRSVIQQVAYQYLIPCIDMGVVVAATKGDIKGITGRVQVLGPDQPCLWCTDLLNSEQVRRDLMTEGERKLDPYIPGGDEPAPAVISLNGTVVSLAVTIFLGVVTGLPTSGRYLIFNALLPGLRPVKAEAKNGCFICSRNGVYGKGDAQALFARAD